MLVVALSHLEGEEKEMAEKLLWEERDVFCLGKEDHGDCPDLQMEIHLTDTVPVRVSHDGGVMGGNPPTERKLAKLPPHELCLPPHSNPPINEEVVHWVCTIFQIFALDMLKYCNFFTIIFVYS